MRRFLNDPTLFLWLSTLWRGPNPWFVQILNSYYLRVICTKFDGNWPAGFRKEKIFKIFKWIFTLLLLSPLKEGVVLHLYNSKSPLPKDDLCQLWLKLTQRFRRTSPKCKSLTDTQTEGWGSSEKLPLVFSSGELKLLRWL
jgi:hypothetical protein